MPSLALFNSCLYQHTTWTTYPGKHWTIPSQKSGRVANKQCNAQLLLSVDSYIQLLIGDFPGSSNFPTWNSDLKGSFWWHSRPWVWNNSTAFVDVSSDAANSHPPRSPVNTGPSPALQCRGTQPGAGSHVNLPVTTHAAQGNGLLQSAYKVCEKTSCKAVTQAKHHCLFLLIVLVLSAPWCSGRPSGSRPAAEQQQRLSEWRHHNTTVLLFHVLLPEPPSRWHLYLPTQPWRHSSGYATRFVSKV